MSRYAVKYALKRDQKIAPDSARHTGRWYGWSRDVRESVKPRSYMELNDSIARDVIKSIRPDVAGWDIVPSIVFCTGIGDDSGL